MTPLNFLHEQWLDAFINSSHSSEYAMAKEALNSHIAHQESEGFESINVPRLRRFLETLANKPAAVVVHQFPDFSWPTLPSVVSSCLAHMREFAALWEIEESRKIQGDHPQPIGLGISPLQAPRRRPCGIPEADVQGDYLKSLRLKLREAWSTQDVRQRDWVLYDLRRLNMRAALSDPAVDYLVDDPPEFWRSLRTTVPPLNPFEQAIAYLQRIPQEVRICKNTECDFMSYFLSPRNLFCSTDCSAHSKRVSTRESARRRRTRERQARRKLLTRSRITFPKKSRSGR